MKIRILSKTNSLNISAVGMGCMEFIPACKKLGVALGRGIFYQ